MGEGIQGRTSESYDDYFADDPQPRIWKASDITDPEHPVPAFHGMAPCGHRFYFANEHEVDEHGDGTFSVQPKPSNSNSILCRVCGWHGYVDHNIWTSV